MRMVLINTKHGGKARQGRTLRPFLLISHGLWYLTGILLQRLDMLVVLLEVDIRECQKGGDNQRPVEDTEDTVYR